jgi:transcriptional regulator with XRE-family HTH domain
MTANQKRRIIVISRERVQRGLTQEHMSELAAIARSHLVALENGEKIARLDTVWRIAEALGTKPSILIAMVETESG